MNQAELEALIEYWNNREIYGPTESSNYARGNADALGLIWKTLYGDAGFSLREWVEMEGPEVEW